MLEKYFFTLNFEITLMCDLNFTGTLPYFIYFNISNLKLDITFIRHKDKIFI